MQSFDLVRASDRSAAIAAGANSADRAARR